MDILIIIGTVFCVLAVLYLCAVMPRMVKRPDYTPLLGWHYAHRGLHDNRGDAPENSMKAFQKAVEAGYGIELDVQLTKDRLPVVFHDETLKRVCGAEGRVRDYTYEELQQFTLYGSSEKIPLFADSLRLVKGRVPLIVEIKIHEKADLVCAKADGLLAGYQGVYCIESFHPQAVHWYKKHRPRVIRGQLSSNFHKPGERETPGKFLVHYLLLNFWCKPDFIAYDHLHKKNLSRVLCRRLYRGLSVAWTIRSRQQMEESRGDFDLFIFEQFEP